MDARSAARPRRRQFLSAPFVQAMLAGHSALGIAFAALIYIVCFSGTMLVFVNDFHRWEQPDAPIQRSAATPDLVAALLAAGYAQAQSEGAAHEMLLIGPSTISPRMEVHYRDEDGTEGEWIADAQGRLVTRIAAPWSEFLAALHTSLHLPRTWGFFLVGLTGVALLSSLISGVLSHPRIFRDAFALRRGGSRRLQEVDLHNRLGVWGLPFHLAVSLTGALLGLSTLIIGVLALAAYEGNSEKAFAAILGPMPGSDERPAPLPDIAAMIRQVQGAEPGAQFVSANIDHMGTAGQVVHLSMKTPGYLAAANTYYFDGSGQLTGDGGRERGTIGQQVLGALQPLHFGWFGGVPIRLAYGVLGLALTVISFNGVTIWLVRRRDKGRPAPGMERFWCALGWSQPLGLGLAAAASLVMEGAPLLALYAMGIAVALAVAFAARDVAMSARLLRLGAAAMVAGVVALHYALRPQDDPMALLINGVLLASAAAIALPALRRRSHPA